MSAGDKVILSFYSQLLYLQHNKFLQFCLIAISFLRLIFPQRNILLRTGMDRTVSFMLKPICSGRKLTGKGNFF